MFNAIKNYKKNQGVTLIELVVVIAIISIMSVVVLVIVSKQTRTKKDLEIEARKVLAVIEQTRNFSLTGKNAGTNNCTNNVFEAAMGGDHTKYGISGCNSVVYNLSSGFTFDSSVSFAFSIPHGKLDFGSGCKDVHIKKNNQHYHICVYSNGEVELKGGQSCGC